MNKYLPHRTLTTVASYARLVSEPKAPALDAAAKVRQNYETTKPNTKKLTDEPRVSREKGIVHALVLRLCRLSTIRSARTTPFELAS